jgi:glycosyltransferase involved in cell wall biosynthesis
MNKIKVLLTTEGTYPYHQGGVSTWCDTLIKNCEHIDFTVFSVTMNPFVTMKFNLFRNTDLIQVPLWGTEEPSEHMGIQFSNVYINRKKTTDKIVEDEFLDKFEILIDEILSGEKDYEKFAKILFDLHKYFKKYEYKKSFKSEKTWNKYKEIIDRITKEKESGILFPDVFGLITSLGWLYRFLNIINTPIPKTHVTHSSASAFCGIPCVISKKLYNSRFMLTEHGVYIREQYLSLSKRLYSSFLNTFLVRLIKSVTGLSYYFADQISPVCEYNTRWERKMGVSDNKIKVIYNGVDKSVFEPGYTNSIDEVTITMVARVDPIKDIKTFIKAADYIKKNLDNYKIKFYVYGSVTVPKYYEECLELRDSLNLSEDFIFAGHSGDVAGIYRNTDIVVLTSISEAFPYSVIEAMMSGKPVIATDVGGVKEALGEGGIIATPGDFIEISKGIIKLIENPMLRIEMGEDGRNRALTYFTIDKIMDIYFKDYINLALGDNFGKEKKYNYNVLLILKKAYASFYGQLYNDALKYFNLALKINPKSIWAPVIHMEISKIYIIINDKKSEIKEFKKAKKKANNIIQGVKL